MRSQIKNTNAFLRGIALILLIQLGGFSLADAQIQMNVGEGNVNLGDGNLNVGGNVNIEGNMTVQDSGTIYVQGDWTNHGTFDPGTGMVVFNGNTYQVINTSEGENFNGLRILNADGVQIDNDVLIQQILELIEGSITLGSGRSGQMTFGDQSTIVREEGQLNVDVEFDGQVNVVYQGDNPLASGPEIPQESGTLNNLTVANQTTVTLSDSTTVNGILNLDEGLLNNENQPLIINPFAGIDQVRGTLARPPIFRGAIDVRYETANPRCTGLELPSDPFSLRDLIIDNPSYVMLNSRAEVNRTLYLLQGIFDVRPDNPDSCYNPSPGPDTLWIEIGATIVREAGELLGDPTFKGAVLLTYRGNSAVNTGSETLADTIKTVHIGNPAGVYMQTDLSVQDSLIFSNNGRLYVGTNTLRYTGLSGLGSIIPAATPPREKHLQTIVTKESGKVLRGTVEDTTEVAGIYTDSTSTVIIHNSNSDQLPATITNIGNLIIDSPSGVHLQNDLHIYGELTLDNGPVTVGAHTLRLEHPVNGNPDGLVFNEHSGFYIAGIDSGIYLPPSTIDTLTHIGSFILDNPAGTVLQGNLLVHESLELRNGRLNNNGFNVILAAGATLTIGNGTVDNIQYLGVIDLAYEGTEPQTTGFELPAEDDVLRNLTINNPTTVTLDKSTTINGTLTLKQGVLANQDHNFTMAENTTIHRYTGTMSQAPYFTTRINLIYDGESAITTANEIPADPTVVQNVTINNTAGITLGQDLRVNQVLELAGALALDAYQLTLTHAIRGNATLLQGGTTASLVITGTSPGIGIPASITELANLTIENPNPITLMADLAIYNQLTLTGGELDVSRYQLTLHNPIAGQPQLLVADEHSSIALAGTSTGLNLPETITQLRLLALDNPNGTTLSGNVAIYEALILAQGTLNAGGFTLTLFDGVTITRHTGQLASMPQFAGEVHLRYTNPHNISTSNEMPANPGTLQRVTFAGSGIVTLTQDMAVNDTLALLSGTLQLDNYRLTLYHPLQQTAGELATTHASAIAIMGDLNGFSIPATVSELSELELHNPNGLLVNHPLTIHTQLIVNAGTLHAEPLQLSLADHATLVIGEGRLANTPQFGDSINLIYNGHTALTTGVELPSQLNNLTIRNSGGITLGADADINGTLTLDTGTFTVATHTLILHQPVAGTLANFLTDATSAIHITGEAEQIQLPDGASQLRELALNNPHGLVLLGDLTIHETLTLTGGMIDPGTHTLTVADGATIYRETGDVAQPIHFAGMIDLVYGGSTAVTSGNEIPTGSGVLRNLTINNPGGVTLLQDATLNGELHLQNGTFALSQNTPFGTIPGDPVPVLEKEADDGIYVTKATPIPSAKAHLRGAALAGKSTQVTKEKALAPAKEANGASPAVKARQNDLRVAASLTFAGGVTIYRENGQLVGTPNFAGQVNVIYRTPHETSTGEELPRTSDALNQLTIETGAPLHLDRDIWVNGTLSLVSGAFHLNANQVSLVQPLNIGEGTLQTTAESAVEIRGIAENILLPETITELATLTVDNPHGTVLPVDLTLYSHLNLLYGTLDNSAVNLTLADGITIQRYDGELTAPVIFEGNGNLTYAGTTAQIGGYELPSTVQNLVINNPNGVEFQHDVTVSGAVQLLAGSLEMGNHTLTLTTTATVEGEQANRYIMGQLVKTAAVGTNASNMGGIGVHISAGETDIGNVTVRRIAGAGGAIDSVTINRHWIITADLPPLDGRTMTLSWIENDDNGMNLSNAIPLKSLDRGSTWFPQSEPQNVAGTRTITVYTETFNTDWWTVSDGETPLPSFAQLDLASRYEIVQPPDAGHQVERCFTLSTIGEPSLVQDFAVEDSLMDALIFVSQDSAIVLSDVVAIDVPPVIDSTAQICFRVDLAHPDIPAAGGVTLVTDEIHFTGSSLGPSGLYSQLYLTILPELSPELLEALGEVDSLHLTDLWVLADFTGNDQCVTSVDLLTLLYAYGAQAGDVNWNPRCDLAVNGFYDRIGFDGQIQFADLVLFANYYGQGNCIPGSRVTPKDRITEVYEAIPVDAQPAYTLATHHQEVTVGESFTVTLTAEMVRDLYASHVVLHYDAGKLAIQNVTEDVHAGPLLATGEVETVFQPQNDATNGILTLDMTSLGQTEGVSGSGVLAEITFTVKNAGDWAMEAVEIVALDSQLQRIEGIALQGLNGTAKHPTRPNIPTTYHLAQNHPNPFNPVTAIRYQLPQTQAVNLRIYDVSGRLVRALVENEIHEAGYYVLEWDGTDDAGQAVSSGMYIYQFDAGPFSQTRQMLLVK